MIKFYQSWCGHCIRMKPDWDKLSKEETSNSLFIADVNCGDQESLCEEEAVHGYPTIKYYIGGKSELYQGGRGYDDLKQFLHEKLIEKCNINNVSMTCSLKEQEYITKWTSATKHFEDVKKESERLRQMEGSSMKQELKRWLSDRIRILLQILDKRTDEAEY